MPVLNGLQSPPVHDAPSVVYRSLPATPAPSPLRAIRSLQLGLGWFPEQAGGLERFYYDLIRALPRDNVSCRGLVIGSDAVALETGGQVSGFAPHSAALMTRWKCSRRAVKSALAGDRFDLVASHFALYTLPLLLKIRRLPLVVHFHGPMAAEAVIERESPRRIFMKYHFERAVYRQADRLIVLSAAFRDILIRDYAVNPDRIRIVPGGIHVERFDIPETRPQARERLGWPTDRPIVLCVRRLIRRMGLEDLIDAARELRKAIPDILILIAGLGHMEELLKKRVVDDSHTDNVRLLGFLQDDDLPLAYRAADLTIVPSTALEGFGLVAVESLASGTPALVTDVGGLPAAVRGLSPDLVLSGTGAAGLCDGIKLALNSGSHLPNADECRNYAKESFGWSTISARVRDVYAEAAG